MLSIDIETYSSYDLNDVGMHKYVSSPEFEILLFAYSLDDGNTVTIIDFKNGQKLPLAIYDMLLDKTVVKSAFNAMFERVCIEKFLGIRTPLESWHCTMIHAAMAGYPMSLDAVSKVLKLKEKDKNGKTLIRLFSMPQKRTGKRVLPEDKPQEWEMFKIYCMQDVVVECEVYKAIKFYPMTQDEKKYYVMDQQINDQGVMVDVGMIRRAIISELTYREKMMKEATVITGLENPNSPQQIKQWLSFNEGLQVDSLSKDLLDYYKESCDSVEAKRLLEIRSELGKTSVKKYQTMKDAVMQDGRIRGLFQFHGAGRTGRWAGRLVQPHNLPKSSMKDDSLAYARELLTNPNDNSYLEDIELMFGNVPDTLSQLIRTAFIAPNGKKLIISDFSAIEARGVAWLANEQWRLDVFKTHGKIYEAAGANMFKVPIADVKKGSIYRDRAKVAELACGYQGAVGALERMGGEKMGLSQEEMQELIHQWRRTNKRIVQLWYDLQEAATECIRTHKSYVVNKKIKFVYHNNHMLIKLPSGRYLSYPGARLGVGPYGDAIYYMGIDQTTMQWKQIDTYGGKLLENITQALCRDLLAHSMWLLHNSGYKIVLHVHDEIVIEAGEHDDQARANVDIAMSIAPTWAIDFPMKGDTFESKFYKKEA